MKNREHVIQGRVWGDRKASWEMLSDPLQTFLIMVLNLRPELYSGGSCALILKVC